MNIIVIGSTGRTGRLVLEEGIRRRHAMTAFTRRRGTCRTYGHGGSGRAAHRHRERFRHRRTAPLDLDQLGPLDPSEAVRRLCPDGTTGRLERPRLDDCPSSVPLERTDDGPGPKPDRSKGSRARSVPHLPRGSRGHASRFGRGLAASRRGALGERAERRRLIRDGPRSKLLFPCPTSEEHRLDRTQGEGHRRIVTSTFAASCASHQRVSRTCASGRILSSPA